MKDYKPRPKAKPTNVGNTLLGIFIGLLLGLLAASAIAIYMMKSPFPWVSKSRPDRAAIDAKADAAKGADETKVAKGGEKPKFDFYRILPGQDSRSGSDNSSLATDTAKAPPPAQDAGKAAVANTSQAPSAKAAVAENAGTAGKAAEAGKAAAKTDSGATELAKADTASRVNYLLQAGAFQNPAEADSVKAKLALLGLESNIETVDLPDRGTWYRVRMGPYRSLSEVNHVRQQLAPSGIDVALVRNNPSP